MLRVQDPYLKPINELLQLRSFKELPYEYFEILLSNLINQSTHKNLLTRFVVRELDYLSFSNSKLNSEIGKLFHHFNFSLNERLSETHITPFHLSMIFNFITKRRQKGQFFTPSYLSDFISKNVLDLYSSCNKLENSDLLKLKCGDIACGTGNLLISLIYRLYERMEKTELSDRDFLDFVSQNIYGFDLDELSLKICQLRILFFLSNFSNLDRLPDFSSTFLQGNSLISSNCCFDTKDNLLLKPLDIDQKFDILVGNPPFMCYGLRNAQEYSEEYKRFLRQRFQSAEYKLNLYPIFIERNLELLKENGILVLLTPDTFFIGRYYSKIRSYILQHSQILDISIFDFEPFKGVTLGRSVISFFRKGEKKEGHPETFKARWINSVKDLYENKWEEYPNSQSDFMKAVYNKFTLFFTDEEKRFVQEWKDKSEYCLGDIVSIHTGVRSKIGQKNIISGKQVDSDWKKGIISGKQVNPFDITYLGHWLNIDSAILWSGGHDDKIVERTKLILRQTGYQIITAVDEENYYHLNNCHSIIMQKDLLDEHILAVVLNSEEFNHLYHILSLERGRTFAQIDIEFLTKMPMINLKDSEKEILSKNYYKMKNRVLKGFKVIPYSLYDLLNLKN